MAKKASKKPAAAKRAAKPATTKPSNKRSTAKPTRGARAEKSVKSSKTATRSKSPAPAAHRYIPPFQQRSMAPPPIIPRPVTTDGKPKKNQAGLSSKELEHFRELLLAKRRELVGDMSSMEREALRSTTGTNLSNLPLHMADMGTDNYEQEFTLGLVEKDRQLLREINRALAKIQDGSYGICEGTSKPISKARLEAQPWAKYSIEFARQMERGMIRR